MIYELIGRIIVGFLWRAYGREIRIAAAAGAGLALTALGIGAYLASREDEEEA